MDVTKSTSVQSAVTSSPSPSNKFVVVAGYMTPDGARSASCWMDSEDRILEALDHWIKYLERYPVSTIKVVRVDELTAELFEDLRREVNEQAVSFIP